MVSVIGYVVLAWLRRPSWLPYLGFVCFWLASSQFGAMCAPEPYRHLMALRRIDWTKEQRAYADSVYRRLQRLEYGFFALLALSGAILLLQ